MQIPRNLNFDALVYCALGDILQAVHGWADGLPTDEVALLNRITERLARRRRGCDIGLQYPMSVSAQMANLHRQGTNQTDLYGSDLAVTISIDATSFLKTAFFQFKKTRNSNAVIEKSQLDDAMSNTSVGRRAFIAAVDDRRLGVRLHDIASIHQAFPNGQRTQTHDVFGWNSLTEWMHSWLSCTSGLPSDPADQNSIEMVLQSFMRPPRNEVAWQTTWQWPKAELEQPDHIPAKSWVAMFMKTENA